MNFVDALRMRGVPFRDGSSPGEVNLCCPFCVERGESADSRFRLGFNVLNGKAHCFNCGWRSRRGWRAIASKLLVGIRVDDTVLGAPTEAKDAKDEEISYPEGYVPFTERSVKNSKWVARAWHYLRRRRLSSGQISLHRIGVTLSGRYRFRVVFPVLRGEELVGLVTRDFTGQNEPKYLNSRGEKYLYNSPIKERTRRHLLLVEGVFDMLVAERALRPHGIICRALLGHAMTGLQEDQINELCPDFIALWPDPDRVGIEGFLSVAKKLSARYPVSAVFPAAHDVGSFRSDAAVFEHFRHNLRPLSPSLELRLLAEVSFSEKAFAYH